MRFNCDRKATRADYFLNWHRWFAWYPVKIKTGDCRWLEIVERKYEYQGQIHPNRFFEPEYRPMNWFLE